MRLQTHYTPLSPANACCDAPHRRSFEFVPGVNRCGNVRPHIGDLPSITFGRARRIPESAVAALIARKLQEAAHA